MAFSNHGPTNDEIVGSFSNMVMGVTTLSGGAGTVTIPQMGAVKGCVATEAGGVAVGATAAGNVITFAGTGSAVVSYIAWGTLRR